jgi:NitT/TauT family transport system permease protein
MSVSSVSTAEQRENDAELSAARSTLLRRRITVNVLRVAVLAVILGGWELGTRACANLHDTSTCVIDKFFWGQPTGIWQQIVTWAQHGTSQGTLWEQILVTLEEAGYGFLIGLVLGVVSGVVLGRNRFLADVLGPYIKAGNSIPRVVLGALFAISMGVVGIQSKVALAAVLVFFVVFFNAFQGVREADRNLLANARILGANQLQLTTAVILPSALTWIIASLHISFSFAMVGAVVGEFLGSVKGVGLLIRISQQSFNANGVFAAMAILAALALTAEFLITFLENRLIRWRPTSSNEVTL